MSLWGSPVSPVGSVQNLGRKRVPGSLAPPPQEQDGARASAWEGEGTPDVGCVAEGRPWPSSSQQEPLSWTPPHCLRPPSRGALILMTVSGEENKTLQEAPRGLGSRAVVGLLTVGVTGCPLGEGPGQSQAQGTLWGLTASSH